MQIIKFKNSIKKHVASGKPVLKTVAKRVKIVRKRANYLYVESHNTLTYWYEDTFLPMWRGDNEPKAVFVVYGRNGRMVEFCE